MQYHLNFCHTTIRFEVDEDAEKVFAPVHRFFRHHITVEAGQEPAFVVRVGSYAAETDVEPWVWNVPSSVIRRSNAAEFNFDAHVVDREGRRSFVNRSMYLDAPRDVAEDRVFVARLGESSTVQFLDFVRDLVIRREESLGTVVLHASGASRGEEAVIIAGPKGAGKTTTLLSVLKRPGWRYFTGDKLFCVRRGEDVLVHPWRDYPFVGVGTIRTDPDLEELIRTEVDPGLDQRDPADKILVDPDVFESWIGSEFSAEPKRLSAVLLPEVAPGRPLEVRHVTHANERRAHLNKIIDRQADTTFFLWQSYLVPDYAAFFRELTALGEALDDVPMVRLTGTLDVDPDAVLDRTPPQEDSPGRASG